MLNKGYKTGAKGAEFDSVTSEIQTRNLGQGEFITFIIKNNICIFFAARHII